VRTARAVAALGALGAGALAAAVTIDELDVARQRGHYSLEANGRLDATPESIYAVLTDYDDNAYSRILDSYKESRYLEPALLAKSVAEDPRRACELRCSRPY